MRKAAGGWTLALILGLAAHVDAQSVMEINPGDSNKDELKLGTLLGFNLNSDQSWANLQPEIFAGFDDVIGGKWRLRAGPSFSSGPSASDSTSFFRSLTLPGQANASILVYYETTQPAKTSTSFYCGFGLGLKAITHKADSVETVAQHNVRLAAGVRYRDRLVLAGQYTFGWHNLTNESERTFKRVFGSQKTGIQYVMFSIQSYVPKADVWFDLTWRLLTTTSDYPTFRDSNRLLAIGLRKDVDLLPAPAR